MVYEEGAHEDDQELFSDLSIDGSEFPLDEGHVFKDGFLNLILLSIKAHIEFRAKVGGVKNHRYLPHSSEAMRIFLKWFVEYYGFLFIQDDPVRSVYLLQFLNELGDRGEFVAGDQQVVGVGSN